MFEHLERTIKVRNIFKILFAALLVLFLVDKVIFFIGKEVLKHSTYRFTSFYYDENVMANSVLVIGNSRADQHFPRYTYKDLTFLNIGSGWVGVPVSSATALDYLEMQPSPDTLIIETSFLDYVGTGSEYGAIQGVFSETVAAASLLDSSNFEIIVREVFFSLRFNENNLINALARIVKQDSTNYTSSNAVITEDIKNKVLTADRVFSLKERNKIILLEMIKKYKLKGVRVYLVTSPMNKVAVESYKGVHEFIKELDDMANSAGVPHLNLISVYEDDLMFADSVHLNRTGQLNFLERFYNCYLQADVNLKCNW
jgi:hypothetical protein